MNKPPQFHCPECGSTFLQKQAARTHPSTVECRALMSESRMYDKGLSPIPLHFKSILQHAEIEFEKAVIWNDTLRQAICMLWVDPNVMKLMFNSEFRELPTNLQIFALKRLDEDAHFLAAFESTHHMGKNIYGGADFVRQQYEYYRTECICGRKSTNN